MEKFLGLPPVASQHGVEVDNLIIIIHYLMFALFIGWGTFYAYTLIRFRKSKHPKADYTGVKSHLSSYIEIAVALFEVALLALFSIPMWTRRVDAFPAENSATVVRIVAEQFAWNIHYPGPDGKFGRTSPDLVSSDNPLGLDRTDPDAKDDITTINQLNIPVGKPVIVHLSSKDVIHSFNLPVMRTKQDAIPGLNIPLWFTPTKTTDEIRQSLIKTINISHFIQTVETVSIPPEQDFAVTGSSNESYILTEAVNDTSGASILSVNDILNKDNVKLLMDNQIKSVKVREVSHIDKYVAAENYVGKDGTAIVSKGDQMSEDAATKLLKMGTTEVKVRPPSNLDTFLSMQQYKDNSGNVIVDVNGFIDDPTIDKLVAAGINDITIAPSTPTEIACAQLCGLGHYRMRGYMTIMTQQDYDKWVADQEASLQPPPADTTTTPTPTDTTKVSASPTTQETAH